MLVFIKETCEHRYYLVEGTDLTVRESRTRQLPLADKTREPLETHGRRYVLKSPLNTCIRSSLHCARLQDQDNINLYRQ